MSMLTFPTHLGESRLTYEGDPTLARTISLALVLLGVLALGCALVVAGLA